MGYCDTNEEMDVQVDAYQHIEAFYEKTTQWERIHF